ncbi:MAG TPA: hypothetical protein VJZ27_08680, partial [Aggregatilineales bacterium]|nr:hypothetical protein [Aggregatilineales bacterium]
PTWTREPTAQSQSGGSRNPGNATRTPFPPTFTPIPIEDICFLFTPEEELNLPGATVNQGNGVTIYWNPIPLDDYRYEVKLYHPDGNLVVQQVVDAAEYTFSADNLITAGYVFGWEVIPLLNGDPVCFPISGEIFVNPVFDE